jgi:hypothetical protein
MGHVIKETKLRWCRRDNLAQVRDTDKIKELQQQDMAVQRHGIGIIVYLEDDFSDFYVKHVLRDLTRPDPVLVKNLTESPSAKETRAVLEAALRGAVRGTAGAIEAVVPQIVEGNRYDVRIWDPTKKVFLDPAPIARQVFKFRDILMLQAYAEFRTALQTSRGTWAVPRHEAETLLSLYEESFQREPVRDPKTGELAYVPKMEYTVDYIWVIRKILVYRPDWHGA